MKLIRHFEALDPYGRPVTLSYHEGVLEVEMPDGSVVPLPGLRSVRRADGEELRRTQKGRYETVDGRTHFLSDDPEAP